MAAAIDADADDDGEAFFRFTVGVHFTFDENARAFAAAHQHVVGPTQIAGDARGLRDEIPGPFGKTYPLSVVGKAVVEGIERRRRWVVAPGWVKAMLVLRTAIAPLFDRGSYKPAAEADTLADGPRSNPPP